MSVLLSECPVIMQNKMLFVKETIVVTNSNNGCRAEGVGHLATKQQITLKKTYINLSRITANMHVPDKFQNLGLFIKTQAFKAIIN